MKFGLLVSGIVAMTLACDATARPDDGAASFDPRWCLCPRGFGNQLPIAAAYIVQLTATADGTTRFQVLDVFSHREVAPHGIGDLIDANEHPGLSLSQDRFLLFNLLGKLDPNDAGPDWQVLKASAQGTLTSVSYMFGPTSADQTFPELGRKCVTPLPLDDIARTISAPSYAECLGTASEVLKIENENDEGCCGSRPSSDFTFGSLLVAGLLWSRRRRRSRLYSA